MIVSLMLLIFEILPLNLIILKRLALFLVLLTGCNRPSENTDDSVPNQGKSSKPPSADSVVVQILSNPVDSEITFQDEFDNYNHYRQGEVKLAVPYVLQDIHWRHQTHFLIFQPYDSLQFFMDKGDNFWMLKTPNPKEEKELNFEVFYRREINPIDKKTHIVWSFQRFQEYLGDLPLREQKIDSVYRRKLDYLADFKNEYDLSETFLSIWQRFIKYERADALLSIVKYEDLDEKHLRELSSIAREFNDDASLANPYYRQSAWKCVQLLSHLASERGKTNLKIFAEQINDRFTGLTKEYLTISLLRYAKENRTQKYFATTTSEYDSLQTSFLATAQSEQYKDYITRNESLEKLVIDQDQVVAANGKPISLNSLFTKGKIHYVDFWASWCAPCMAEMPASKMLKQKYAGKPINFLYFSRDDNPVAWERAVKRLGFSASESYMMPAMKKSALATKLKISTIPRYVIIDDQGNILDRDAPRPSDPKVGEVLNRLLEK